MLLPLVLTRSALALSCMYGAYDASVASGEELPPNAVIALEHTAVDGDLEVELSTGAGDAVAFTLVEDVSHTVVVPDADLPDGKYVVRALGLERTFSVGGEPDLEAPEAPAQVTVERHRELSEWGESRTLQVDYALPKGEDVHVEVEIDPDPGFTDPQRVVSVADGAWIGLSLCGMNVASYDHSLDYWVRVRSVDDAGNASDWVVVEPAIRRPGCDATGGAAFGVWGLGLVLLAVGRRRD